MNDQLAHDAIKELSIRLGADLELDGDELRVAGATISLPAFSVEAQRADPLLDLKYALPSRAHGDAREKLLYMILQDASPDGRPTMLDATFRSNLQEWLDILDPLARQVIGEAMKDAYWTKPDKNYYPIPYHARIPLSFKLSRMAGSKPVEARYKLFSGAILPFLCWRDTDVNLEPIRELFSLLSSEDGFSLVDRLELEAAVKAAPDRPPAPSVDALVQQMDTETRRALEERPFCPFALTQFQDDLMTLLHLREKLPRRDLVDMITLLFSLHLGTYYYRLALVLGAQVDEVIRVIGEPKGMEAAAGLCSCSGPLSRCSLAGRIRFRVGAGGDRPVSMQDGCAIAFRELDAKRLHPLSATIVTANIAQALWSQLGGPNGRPQLQELARELRRSPAFRDLFDLAAAGAASVLACKTGIANTPEEGAVIGARRPGMFALRETVLSSRRRSLKYLARDVVNQLVKRESTGGILIRTRGRVQFFEVDEDMLFLLVAIICEDREVPYQEFLQGLLRYGLAPQDANERTLLADALERLGMLKRYSDAGDSIYVQYVD